MISKHSITLDVKTPKTGTAFTTLNCAVNCFKYLKKYDGPTWVILEFFPKVFSTSFSMYSPVQYKNILNILNK